jgi:hypothetical protein
MRRLVLGIIALSFLAGAGCSKTETVKVPDKPAAPLKESTMKSEPSAKSASAVEK